MSLSWFCEYPFFPPLPLVCFLALPFPSLSLHFYRPIVLSSIIMPSTLSLPIFAIHRSPSITHHNPIYCSSHALPLDLLAVSLLSTGHTIHPDLPVHCLSIGNPLSTHHTLTPHPSPLSTHHTLRPHPTMLLVVPPRPEHLDIRHRHPSKAGDATRPKRR